MPIFRNPTLGASAQFVEVTHQWATVDQNHATARLFPDLTRECLPSTDQCIFCNGKKIAKTRTSSSSLSRRGFLPLPALLDFRLPSTSGVASDFLPPPPLSALGWPSSRSLQSLFNSIFYFISHRAIQSVRIFQSSTSLINCAYNLLSVIDCWFNSKYH